MRRRHVLFALLPMLGIGLLAGCGQKGPLFMPPPRPNVATPATTPPPPAKPAPATTAPAAVPDAGRG